MLCVNLWNGLRAFGGIVVFWWASGNPSTPDLKLVSLRNWVVHVWPLASSPASGPFGAILKSLGFRSHTPCSWEMKGASSDHMHLS